MTGINTPGQALGPASADAFRRKRRGIDPACRRKNTLASKYFYSSNKFGMAKGTAAG